MGETSRIQENQYPMGFVIDLGAALRRDTGRGVRLTYDNVGRDRYVYFSTGTPGAWTLPPLLTDKWEQWRIPVGVRTRFTSTSRSRTGASD